MSTSHGFVGGVERRPRSGKGFVFYKQKTGYEVRISDWSSDVCSSNITSSTGIRNLTGNHFWGRQHNMLSIIAFIGGAAIGGFAVGIPAVLEIRRINSRGWECDWKSTRLNSSN